MANTREQRIAGINIILDGLRDPATHDREGLQQVIAESYADELETVESLRSQLSDLQAKFRRTVTCR